MGPIEGLPRASQGPPKGLPPLYTPPPSPPFASQWIPETFITDTKLMGPIEGVPLVARERFRLLCSGCRERVGACIQVGL